MGGITTGVGLFSGLDTNSLIEQLLSIESRPKVLAQSRLVQLRGQKAAYLDINTRIDALKNLAKGFRTDNVFRNKSAQVSNESILSATASQSAAPGSYNFIVDRLVSTQQLLTRGFADRDTSAIGLESLSFESAAARLDRETSLEDLNNGNGITRGTITVNGTDVDLSRAGTVSDVLDALNEVSGVSAYTDNGSIVVQGVSTIANKNAAKDVLGSLGLNQTIDPEGTITGTSVYGLNANTALSALNDGRGVLTRNASGTSIYDFTIRVDTNGDNILDSNDTTVNIRLGDIEENVDADGDPLTEDDITLEVTSPAVSTVGGAVTRINDALSAQFGSDVQVAIDPSTGALTINDAQGRDIQIADYAGSGSPSSAATDLGIAGTYTTGSGTGRRVFAGLNSTLISSINGANGLGSTDGLLTFSTRDSTNFLVDISGLGDVNDIINAINNDPTNDGRVIASLNAKGTGIAITDTSVGPDTFTIGGTGGADTAELLGIAGAHTSGSTTGTNLQLGYYGAATRLDSLYNGAGVGTGSFEIIDSNNNRAEISIGAGDVTLSDVIRRINQNSTIDVTARINDTGDGIIIEDTGGGANELTITDTDGSVAEKLRFEGTASGSGADNFIDGSFEINIDIDATSTLEDIRQAINNADAGVSASIVNTGSGSAPFRLSLASDETGVEGRFIIDSGDFDLGVTTIDEGQNARVFFGSSNPADAILISSSSNQLDGVIQGVTIDLKSTSADPVTISVSQDTSSIEEKINEFVESFNAAVERLDFQTRFDQETEERGTLLGDGTVASLRNSLFSAILRSNDGFTGTFDSLTEIGFKIGSGSVLEFDAAKFRDAYDRDPDSVEALFTTRTIDTSANDDDPNTDDELVFSERGVMFQLEQLTETYTDSLSGILVNRQNAFDDQIELQESRIEQFDERLEARRAVLQAQFLAMEQSIAQLQSQGSSLSQISLIG